MDRIAMTVKVTKWLLLFTLIALLTTIALFAFAYSREGRFPVSWFCFGCGVIGGFVSIEQRLKHLAKEDLEYLCASWSAVVIVPIFGGVFALVLYLLFLSGVIQGHAFPRFSIHEFANPPEPGDLLAFFRNTWPASGQDFAKLAVWSFAAGFSERLVPDFLTNRFAGNRSAPSDTDVGLKKTTAEGTDDKSLG